MSETIAAERGKLLRVLGVVFGIAAVVGGVVGQGILRAPGVTAQGIPVAELFLLVWAAGAVVTAIDAMTSVELSSSIPKAGGPYVFAGRAFGPFGGFLCGWLDAGMLILSTGYIAVVGAEFLQRLGLFAAVPTGMAALCVVALMAALNAAGTRVSGLVQTASSAIKGLALLAFAAACFLFRGEARAPSPEEAQIAPMTLAGVALAVIAVQQTYYGANTPVYFSEEIAKPEQNMPRAIFFGVLAVAVVYLAIAGAVVYVLPMAAIGASDLAVGDAMAFVMGDGAGLAVNIFALFSVFTVGYVAMMQQTRTLFAMGRARQLPRVLDRVMGNGAPITALLAGAVISGALAATGVYERLIAIGAPILTLIMMILGASAIVLRRKEPALARPWKMPFYPLPALFTIFMNLGLMAFFTAADLSNTRWSFLFILSAIPVYFLMRRRAA